MLNFDRLITKITYQIIIESIALLPFQSIIADLLSFVYKEGITRKPLVQILIFIRQSYRKKLSYLFLKINCITY